MNEEKKDSVVGSAEGGTTQKAVVDTLFDVGEAWASYGLKTAEHAVAASAKTLEGLSKLLGSLSEELKRERKTSEVIDVPAEG